MGHVITALKTLGVPGAAEQPNFDLAAHAPSRQLYVARAWAGKVWLQVWRLADDGSFAPLGDEQVVGTGTRVRVLAFDNHRLAVAWLDPSATLWLRGYICGDGGVAYEGSQVMVETTINAFDATPVGVVSAPREPHPDQAVYAPNRDFGLTTTSANGGWKLWRCGVLDSAQAYIGPVTAGGPGTRVASGFAALNEQFPDGAHPRKALTLCSDGPLLKMRSWRLAWDGNPPLADRSEERLFSAAAVHGLSLAPGQDFFAAMDQGNTFATRLQLLQVAADGAMTVYASSTLDGLPQVARLDPRSADVAVVYPQPLGYVVAAWRFAAPGSPAPACTVLASAAVPDQSARVRIVSLVPADPARPALLVSAGHVGGKLRLRSWRLAWVPLFQNPGRLFGAG